MSWLSALGKVGAGIAAPFTGGLSLAAIPAIDAIGGAMSGAAKGSADQRSSENRDAIGYGQLANNQARDQFSSGLDAAKFQQGTQDREERRAMLAALLGGMQDASITPGNPAIAARMATSTGGARPSALAGTKDSLLAMLSRQTNDAPTLAPYQPAQLPQLQQQGAVEKILGGIGMGSNILGAIGKATQKPRAK